MKSPAKYLSETMRLALPLGILACGVLAFAAIASQRTPPTPTERVEPVPLVETERVEAHPGGLDIDVSGVVVPHREISISAEVGGRVVHKDPQCRAGRYVTAGTLLVTIDPRSYQLEVERLTEEVEQADASLDELDVEIANAKSLITLAEEQSQLRRRELERAQMLRDRNATSESALDQARRDELDARNNLVGLQNQLRKAEATRTRLESALRLARTRLKSAQLDLGKTELRAPVDGVIVSESIEESSLVQSGTALFTVEDTSAVEVQCSLRMEELDWILRQQDAPSSRHLPPGPQRDYQLPQTPVTVTYQLGNRASHWDGVLWSYDGIGLDERTRTVPCRILVEQPRRPTSGRNKAEPVVGGPAALVRSMFVNVTIHTRPGLTLLRVPERAVQPGSIVWRVNDGRLERVRLPNLTLLDDVVLVRESAGGLSAGDAVVTTPLPIATEGMTVEVKEVDEDQVLAVESEQ